jgi:hypothetical protein
MATRDMIQKKAIEKQQLHNSIHPNEGALSPSALDLAAHVIQEREDLKREPSAAMYLTSM